ncbi:MAG TPA: class I SAM-dependent methyltransferase, partial [Jiangellales bacterium]|nr:class I SAM-dependent methyltransferase [Jiangellales bacterium]
MKAPDDATTRALRVWDRMAPRYDRDMRLMEKLWFGGGRQWIADRVRGEVLEVAIGTGLNLDHYPDDVSITGVELSPAMLAVARRRAADLGRPVALHEGDAQALPYGDDTFDTVVCALSLCAIPDPATAIGEMRRVLRPGGRLLLLDHVASTWWPIRAGQRMLERLTVPTAGEHFTRRQLPLVVAAGLVVEEAQRLKAGTME